MRKTLFSHRHDFLRAAKKLRREDNEKSGALCVAHGRAVKQLDLDFGNSIYDVFSLYVGEAKCYFPKSVKV